MGRDRFVGANDDDGDDFNVIESWLDETDADDDVHAALKGIKEFQWRMRAALPRDRETLARMNEDELREVISNALMVGGE